jgi:osmotically inducible protein OsmC
MQRKGSAVWSGGLKDGKGTVSTQSGVLKDTPYSFATRFENGVGTNPEELLGAAHAGCFTMAFSGQLDAVGLKADRIATEATVSLEKGEGGFAITSVHLAMIAKIPNATEQQFQTAANNAKAGCPVSKLFNTKITLDAKLEK